MDPILVLASRNLKKRRELETILNGLPVQIKTLDDFPGIVEIEETGDTFLENAEIKARAVARATGHRALADDSGLEVDALDGAPGVRSARYAGHEKDRNRDTKNNEKLLGELENVPDEKRTARFRCAIAVAAPSSDQPGEASIIGSSTGSVEGKILREPRGKSGFGYDPVFYSIELGMTFAEADPESKNRISHRRRALEAIKPILERASHGHPSREPDRSNP